MGKYPKSTEKKRHYCSVCSNFRGKEVEGKEIVIHKFPADETLRKTWIRRIKTVMPRFSFNQNSRLCSAHFVDGRKTEEHNVPSVFRLKSKKKLFATSKVTPVEFIPEVDTEPQASTSAGYVTMEEENETFDESEETVNMESEQVSFQTLGTAEITSVYLNDYCGPVLSASDKLNKLVQTSECFSTNECTRRVTSTNEKSTQTDCVSFSSTLSQTEESVSLNEVKKYETVSIQTSLPDITFDDIRNNDDQIMFYTGLPNSGTFTALFDSMDDAAIQTQRKGKGTSKSGRPRTLRMIDEFFLLLMRLRLGLLVEDLAGRFHISKSTCSAIISKWVDYLYVKLSPLLVWPERNVIRETMPQKFRKRYPHCRVIIDCTELYTETPQSLVNKTLMYSHYKSHMTYKALLGISPSGIITFVSDLWAGSISDKQITKKSGLLDLCEKGDAIMGDKGFLISDLTTAKGIHLIIPPRKFQKFTRRQVEETRRIANLRIDVERAMERVKNFRILQGVIPITLAPQANKHWKMCLSFKFTATLSK